MGIEGDQLVFDYLSRVGDLAQRALPSGQRMRLVAQLRANIDKVRTAEGAHSAPAVKQILARFGSPDAIVEAAKVDPESAVPDVAVRPGDPPPGGGQRGIAGRLPRPRVGGADKWLGRFPRPRSGADEPGGGARPFGTHGSKPGTPGAADPAVPEPPDPSPTAASPPHLAGEDELNPANADPDWWHVESTHFGGMPPGGPGSDTVPGFTGGIEVPDFFKASEHQDDTGPATLPRQLRRQDARKQDLRKQSRAHDLRKQDEEPGEDAEHDAGEDDQPPAPRSAVLSGLLRSSGPLEVLAVVALLAGAVLGQWLAVVIGWLLAYSSRRLTRTEAKWAALGVPGTVVLAALVWLWGRFDGRWGEPVEDGTMGTEMTELFPFVVRAAAVASALFLLWRARRRLRG